MVLTLSFLWAVSSRLPYIILIISFVPPKSWEGSWVDFLLPQDLSSSINNCVRGCNSLLCLSCHRIILKTRELQFLDDLYSSLKDNNQITQFPQTALHTWANLGLSWLTAAFLLSCHCSEDNDPVPSHIHWEQVGHRFLWNSQIPLYVIHLGELGRSLVRKKCSEIV